MDRRAPVRHSLISRCLLHIFRILSRKDRKSTFGRPRFASDIRKLISHVALDHGRAFPMDRRAPVRHSLISRCLLHILRKFEPERQEINIRKTSLRFGHSEVDFPRSARPRASFPHGPPSSSSAFPHIPLSPAYLPNVKPERQEINIRKTSLRFGYSEVDFIVASFSHRDVNVFLAIWNDL